MDQTEILKKPPHTKEEIPFSQVKKIVRDILAHSPDAGLRQVHAIAPGNISLVRLGLALYDVAGEKPFAS